MALPTKCPEGLPTVLLEAMAFGLPVVISQKGGVKEHFTDGENGIQVQPGSINEVMNAIRILSKKDRTYERMATRNYRQARQQYLSSTVAGRLKRNFRECERQ